MKKTQITEDDVVAYIVQTPDSTAKQIRLGLKCEAPRLGYLLWKLKAAGTVQGKGATSGVKYTIVVAKKGKKGGR